ncbi:hypothetical protein INR49_013503 [Caranx melampygus]|nr:hypothetical protein INR49_013503 [Caranx melampygus]
MLQNCLINWKKEQDEVFLVLQVPENLQLILCLAVMAGKCQLTIPARIEPLLANRSRPFFLRMKLAPINTLELTASERPM